MSCLRIILLGGLVLALSRVLPAQDTLPPRAQAVLLSASVQTMPPQITLHWEGGATGTGYAVYRKAVEEEAWGRPLATLSITRKSYTDTAVCVGVRYDYRVAQLLTPEKSASSYLRAGMAVPLVQQRGTVILVVDTQTAREMPEELAQLQRDLVGDDWRLIRHDIDPTMDPAALRRLLQNDYFAAPATVRALYLFGRIPLRKSGNLSPDGHDFRPFPCDAYYADLDGIWTDAREAAPSKAGDGVLDQNTIPSDVELAVGRVDMGRLPAFNRTYAGSNYMPKDESALLRQYLGKAHRFRTAAFIPERRALVDDFWWNICKMPCMTDAWRALAPLVGAERIVERAWRQELPAHAYLWAVGSGPGGYDNAVNITSSANLAVDDPRAVFTMLYGSYFVEWDATDNLMRSVLATTTAGLSCEWGVQPFRRLFPLGLGETIGETNRLTQSDHGRYAADSTDTFRPQVSVTLLGDPTLCLHSVPPPRTVTSTRVKDSVALAWTVAPDPAVAGYHVYRAPALYGPYTRLTRASLPGTAFRDATPLPGTNYYMVRAVKLEVTPSGSYENASVGAPLRVELPTADYQPDLLLKNAADSLFSGEGDFADTSEQRKAQIVLDATPLVYDLRLRNAGARPDAFVISAPVARTGWQVHLREARSREDITVNVNGNGWVTPLLAPGESCDIHVEIIPRRSAHAPFTLPVRAVSVHEKRRVDCVRLSALPMAGIQPRLTVCDAQARPVQAAATQLTGTLRAGEHKSYLATITNPAHAPCTMLLTCEQRLPANTAQWQYHLFDAAGKDLTIDASYNGLEVAMPPDGSRSYRLELFSPTSSAVYPTGKRLDVHLIVAAPGVVTNSAQMEITLDVVAE